ncbi:NmrA family NAD(P)-binding protein [Actinoplanes sp. NPDC048967]|uniref:NmrA family NAD(P)-binding protein n=1 Tax=Actinoplanes sp. NPDC048967 TaxID=3155269 RepID=UPI0033F87C7E
MAPVLVTGGTGKQGGAVTRALLAGGVAVRALVRDPYAEAAKALAALGAELVVGDLDELGTLVPAATGARGVFSVQTPDVTDLGSDSEIVRGRNLIAAARAAGVPQFVHTSVAGAGEFARSTPGWTEGRWNTHYWESKAAIDEAVRGAGFASWTVLKPATFMENLLGWSFMFGNWAQDGFVTTFGPDTKLSWVAVDDIGTAAAAAFADPARWHGVDLDLAGERLTMTEVAATLTEVLGRPVPAPVLTADQAVARGLPEMMVPMQEWTELMGSPARPEQAHAYGLPTTDFRTWAQAHLG